MRTIHDLSENFSDGLLFPKGTSAERGNPEAGYFRYNTETKSIEVYDGTSWSSMDNTPSYVTNGLVLNLDAGNLNSYSGSGATWADLAQDGNDGTINGATYDSNGHFTFNGSNNYVDCGSSPITSNSVFSWEAWIYPSSTGTPFFLGVESNNQAMVSYWDASNSKVRVGVWGSDKLTSNTAISGGWGHTCWTWDGTTLRAYTNGAADGDVTGFSFNIANNYMMVGSTYATQRFGGKIGTVKLYDKVLTAAEVLSNYNATKTRFGL